jgi:hypothetical protein
MVILPLFYFNYNGIVTVY